MAYTVVGLFDSSDKAGSVVSDLLKAGVEEKQISFLTTQQQAGDKPAALGTSTATGALVGGIGGLLIGLGALAIPGIGPILAAGPLAVTLVGAGVGATGGALAGALRDMGIPEADVGLYAESVRRGATLVSVTADDTLADSIADILDRHGARNVEERRAALAREGWTGFDESAGPYQGGNVPPTKIE